MCSIAHTASSSIRELKMARKINWGYRAWKQRVAKVGTEWRAHCWPRESEQAPGSRDLCTRPSQGGWEFSGKIVGAGQALLAEGGERPRSEKGRGCTGDNAA